VRFPLLFKSTLTFDVPSGRAAYSMMITRIFSIVKYMCNLRLSDR
jgi:hypothetical protein